MEKQFRSFIVLIFGVIFLFGFTIQDFSDTKQISFIQSFNFLNRRMKLVKANIIKASRSGPMTEYISQKLNHSDPNSETWDMRFISNGKFHKPNGPIFIFVGGEDKINDDFVLGGMLYDMAHEHNGFLFTTEHRFYGDSIPTDDLSLKNLQHLTSYQALADLANFIRIQKSKPEFKNSKVILGSGSYAGALTVWFQRLYPGLVAGSWASSAPLEAKYEFYEFKEVVGQSIQTIGGEACYSRFDYGIQKLEKLVNNKNVLKLKQLLKICDNFDIENWLDIAILFSSISNIAAGLVQNHNEGDIEQDCEDMLSAPDDLTGLVNWFNSKIPSQQCHDYTFASTVAFMKYANVTDSSYRQWTYTLCTEFGYAQTSKSYYQPFGTKFPVQLNEYICYHVFGITPSELRAKVRKTNSFYGGLSPNVTNVFYSQGELDPWRPIGVQKNDDGASCIIPRYAHFKDFDSISDDDSPEMRASKEKLKKYVRKWLGKI